MDKIGPTLLIVAIVAIVFLGMWWGWKRRNRRDRGVQLVRTIPAEIGAQLAETEVFYVATTRHDNALERIAAKGLSFRGRATVTVAEAGIALAITGQEPIFIPVDDIEGVSQATVTIDRVVEKDGLVKLVWGVSDAFDTAKTPIDTFLRVIDPTELGGLLNAIHKIQHLHNTESGV